MIKRIVRYVTPRLLARIILWFVAGAATLGGGVRYWYYHRPQPRNQRRVLFEGITYVRESRRKPRPMVIHVVTVDLSAPGLGFLVTPGDPVALRPLRAHKTSQFLSQFHTQLAINGDFFYPWHSNSLWDYYPHIGDTVDTEGFACSRGTAYSTQPDKRKWPTLYLSRDNRPSFRKPAGPVFNAISGSGVLIDHGRVLVPAATDRDLNPRTAVALDRDARKLIIVLIDGRQPNYSEGATLTELANILISYGGDTAINLDGGGSTTLVVEDERHRPVVLNCPIDNHIPGRERPVANHLGIFARPVPHARR